MPLFTQTESLGDPVKMLVRGLSPMQMKQFFFGAVLKQALDRKG
jgi:hypothetical protein